MTFSKAWQTFSQHLFSAKGCATRSEYNWVMGPSLAIFIFFAAVGFMVISNHPMMGLSLIGFAILCAILIIIFGYCLLARRYHDTGSSKWNALIVLVPTLRYIDLIYMMLAPSDPERNRKYQN